MTFAEIAVDFLKAVTAELDPYTSEKGIIQTNQSSQTVTLFTPAHIQFAKYGRGPGKQPPIDSILKWVSREGIIFEDSTQEGTAWAIAKSIAKNGTSNWVPNAPNALEEALNENIQRYVDEVNQRVIDVTSGEVEKIYREEFPDEIDFKM